MSFINVSGRATVFLLALFALVFMSSVPAVAQEEGVPVVLDEPIVQVNNDVIMLSTLNRELATLKEVLIKQRGLTERQATDELEKKRSEIIFSLMNESLLVQKGKDTPGMSEDVEADVNREVLRVARQYNLKTIEELRQKMKEQGENLSDVQETLRRHYFRQAVFSNEVDRKVYFSITEAEARKFHTENRTKFQSVQLSEIFLSLAGREETEILNKANQIIGEARAGKDFAELVLKHSERENKEKTKGVLGEDGKPRSFLVAELSEQIAKAVKDLKAGGVSDPIKLEEGYLILRVNSRDDAFIERHVRAIMTQDRAEKEREVYLRTLRQEAYIKPAKDYAGIIQPMLDKDVQASAAAAIKDKATAAPNAKEKQ